MPCCVNLLEGQAKHAVKVNSTLMRSRQVIIGEEANEPPSTDIGLEIFSRVEIVSHTLRHASAAGRYG